MYSPKDNTYMYMYVYIHIIITSVKKKIIIVGILYRKVDISLFTNCLLF